MARGVRKFRTGGSAYSVFHWRGERIAFAQQVSHTSPTGVGPGPVPIQSLDAKVPQEIITPAATGMGQIQMQLYELYGEKVWDELSILAGSNNLQEIFERVAATPEAISMTKYVFPPNGSGVPNYSETYHNCVITNVIDGETIEVGTMEVMKQIVVGYTHSTRSDAHGQSANR